MLVLLSMFRGVYYGYHRMVSDATPPLGPDGPAHEPDALIRALADTRSPDSGADLLRDRDNAVDWLRQAGLLPAEAGLSNSEHAAVLRLRDALKDVLAAHANGHQDADAAARLTRALADGRLVLTVDESNAVRLASAARASYPNTVALVAVAIAASEMFSKG